MLQRAKALNNRASSNGSSGLLKKIACDYTGEESSVWEVGRAGATKKKEVSLKIPCFLSCTALLWEGHTAQLQLATSVGHSGYSDKETEKTLR